MGWQDGKERRKSTGPPANARISRSFKCYQEGTGIEATECRWVSNGVVGTTESYAFQMELGARMELVECMAGGKHEQPLQVGL